MTWRTDPQDTRLKRRLKLLYLVPLAFLLIPYNMGGYLYEQIKEVVQTAIKSWWHEPYTPLEVAFEKLLDGLDQQARAIGNAFVQIDVEKLRKARTAEPPTKTADEKKE